MNVNKATTGKKPVNAIHSMKKENNNKQKKSMERGAFPNAGQTAAVLMTSNGGKSKSNNVYQLVITNATLNVLQTLLHIYLTRKCIKEHKHTHTHRNIIKYTRPRSHSPRHSSNLYAFFARATIELVSYERNVCIE